MKTAIFAALVASAAAFTPTKDASRASVATKAAMDDLKTIAEKSNPVLKVGN
jgi:Skp family chaperone for outer membrane proteins